MNSHLKRLSRGEAMSLMTGLFCLCLALIAAPSCTQSDIASIIPGDMPEDGLAGAKTRADVSSFFVDEDDIDCYITFKSMIEKEDVKVNSIVPVSKAGNVLAYAINYENSWELVSADRRTPQVLATGSGKYQEKECNPAAKAWLDDILACVEGLSGLTELNEVHKANVNHWKMITQDQAYLERICGGQTRSGNSLQYRIVRIDTVYTGTPTPHLICAEWGQTSPFNMYCPLKSNSDTERAPAGCVAVAGAQMAYHLHGLWGYPATAPERASCSGHVGGTISMSQYDFTADAWDMIDEGDTTVIAALIAYVGSVVEMVYGNDFSGADTRYLSSPLFNDIYHCETEYMDYDEDVVYELLQNDIPVVTKGGGQSGDAFIIDRYFDSATEYYYTIQIINGNVVGELDHIEYGRTLFWGMNWGYGGIGNDNLYVTTAPWMYGASNYHNNVKIINFIQQ